MRRHLLGGVLANHRRRLCRGLLRAGRDAYGDSRNTTQERRQSHNRNVDERRAGRFLIVAV